MSPSTVGALGSATSITSSEPSTSSRVRQRYWDPKEERIVNREELVKGYEFEREK